MPFQPGRVKTGGRIVGTPNKFTGVFREAVLSVYNGLGGHKAFLEWARENPTEYYKIAARLIPVELRSEEDRVLNIIIDRSFKTPREQTIIEATPVKIAGQRIEGE